MSTPKVIAEHIEVTSADGTVTCTLVGRLR